MLAAYQKQTLVPALFRVEQDPLDVRQLIKMWREARLLLIDDNLSRSHSLAIIFNFPGEDQLTCNSEDWQEIAAGLSDGHEALYMLLDSVESKGGAVKLLKQLASWDEYLPILLIGEPAPAD